MSNNTLSRDRLRPIDGLGREIMDAFRAVTRAKRIGTDITDVQAKNLGELVSAYEHLHTVLDAMNSKRCMDFVDTVAGLRELLSEPGLKAEFDKAARSDVGKARLCANGATEKEIRWTMPLSFLGDLTLALEHVSSRDLEVRKISRWPRRG